ncbi:hypothetical protein [Nocardia paucivorans]|uniref:hypothetical protein n=1 Tax=Nocardia paucivorans TaxID=114259 RepID=UPI0002F4A346|nr:hypothetical protein [Nocardia paucivorans]
MTHDNDFTTEAVGAEAPAVAALADSAAKALAVLYAATVADAPTLARAAEDLAETACVVADRVTGPLWDGALDAELLAALVLETVPTDLLDIAATYTEAAEEVRL